MSSEAVEKAVSALTCAFNDPMVTSSTLTASIQALILAHLAPQPAPGRREERESECVRMFVDTLLATQDTEQERRDAGATFQAALSRELAAARASERERFVLIWSNEHGAWWAPNHHGYTKARREAGLYPLREAEEIVEDANASQSEREVPNESIVFTAIAGESERAHV